MGLRAGMADAFHVSTPREETGLQEQTRLPPGGIEQGEEKWRMEVGHDAQHRSVRLLLPQGRGKGEVRQPPDRRCSPRVRPKGNDPNEDVVVRVPVPFFRWSLASRSCEPRGPLVVHHRR